MTEAEIRELVVSNAKKYLGYKESDGTHKKIVDIYNNHKPLPSGYKVTYKDSWCATFVSAIGIKSNLSDVILKECSCARMIELYKKAGRWEERDDYVPNIGDIIMYDWQDSGVGDNKGHPDHVGIVCSVANGTMQIIEGNYKDSVGYRMMKVNGKNIRGYCLPNYASKATKKQNVETNQQKTSTTLSLSKAKKLDGIVTASLLNVRVWAGTENKLCSFSPLKNGASVGICDSVNDKNGKTWYYICYNGKYGFVSAQYIRIK